jgi:transcriptional regulator with XRE-family HTH domain
MPKKKHPESLKSVGARLELLRLAMGLENQALAGLIGVSPQQWRNYKVGDNVLPPAAAIRLCTVTGATTDFIYRGDRGGLPGYLLEKLAKIEASPKSLPAKTG